MFDRRVGAHTYAGKRGTETVRPRVVKLFKGIMRVFPYLLEGRVTNATDRCLLAGLGEEEMAYEIIFWKMGGGGGE